MAFKRIYEYTDQELKDGISEAVAHCKVVELDFYKILKGIDSYFEQRKRKLAAEAEAAKTGHKPL